VLTALLGATDSWDKLSWYAARSSGIVAWALVTASILWGLALSTRIVRRRGAPAWILDLHKFLSTLSLVFVAVHVFALWCDNWVYFGPKELAVPMASPWRPGAVAWGIVATYLLIAIQVTSWMMARLPRRVWHSVHLTSIVLFAFATVHGFQAGADRTNVLVQWAALTGALMVCFLLGIRLGSRARKQQVLRPLPGVRGGGDVFVPRRVDREHAERVRSLRHRSETR
jgi:predicted ferric reductase